MHTDQTNTAQHHWLRVLPATLLLCAGAAFAAPPAFKLSSPDLPPVASPDQSFTEKLMANTFGCTGGNESPELKWSGAPEGTKGFAITMFDYFQPPVSGWWHWIVYNLPGSSSGLPHGAGSVGGAGMPSGAVQGPPDGEAPEHHYYGPCPDIGDAPHRYVITVYALKVDHLDIPKTASAADIDYEISSKALAHASIERKFQRLKK